MRLISAFMTRAAAEPSRLSGEQRCLLRHIRLNDFREPKGFLRAALVTGWALGASRSHSEGLRGLERGAHCFLVWDCSADSQALELAKMMNLAWESAGNPPVL